MITQRRKYKGWLMAFDNATLLWSLYTPSELEQPIGFREPEAEISNIDEAKKFIDNYNKY